MAKAESGRQALNAINPEIEIVPLQRAYPAPPLMRW
jgi:hypothetical protein